MTRNEAILKIKFWTVDRCGSFYSSLIDCISKADHLNKRCLARVFPELCAAFDEWQIKGDNLFEELS